MGTFYMPIEIGGADRERFETVEALVDTGATYSAMPASILRALGVSPFDRRTLRLADGNLIYKDIGEMSIRINGSV